MARDQERAPLLGQVLATLHLHLEPAIEQRVEAGAQPLGQLGVPAEGIEAGVAAGKRARGHAAPRRRPSV